MHRRTKILIAAAAVGSLTLAGGAVTAAVVTDDEGPDTAISGDALQRASDAALAHTGEGTVSETEVGDEESYYEVEVTLEDGSQVDVQLDESFDVVGQEADNDATEDESGADD